MVMQSVAGHRVGEDVDDLQAWLRALDGCPTVTHTAVASCANTTHEEPATWFYVEADSAKALARRRCLACGTAKHAFDSEERWDMPAMWSCTSCSQSIAEVAAGLHVEDDRVTWVALAVRCVGCGALEGVTDFVVDDSYPDVLARL